MEKHEEKRYVKRTQKDYGSISKVKNWFGSKFLNW